MDRRPLLPGAVVAMLAIALAIYLIEKIGQALLAISNVILLVALAWILTLMLRPAVNWIHSLTLPDRLIQPLRQRWGSRVADRLVHPSLRLFDLNRLSPAAGRGLRHRAGPHPAGD